MPVIGSLGITGGTIRGTGFRADVDGALSRGGERTSYDGQVAGTFFGSGADSLIGTVVAVETPEGEAPRVVYGGVVAD